MRIRTNEITLRIHPIPSHPILSKKWMKHTAFWTLSCETIPLGELRRCCKVAIFSILCMVDDVWIYIRRAVVFIRSSILDSIIVHIYIHYLTFAQVLVPSLGHSSLVAPLNGWVYQPVASVSDQLLAKRWLMKEGVCYLLNHYYINNWKIRDEQEEWIER